MTQTKDNSVKILFNFFSNVLEEWTVETMWADTVSKDKGLYKLDNIPFYAPVASDDIVFAVYDETEHMLIYQKTVEYSGNSTIQVVLMETTSDISNICDRLKEFGCLAEKLNDRYFAMEVPADKDYVPIKQLLGELENEGIISYAEPCLSDKHQY